VKRHSVTETTIEALQRSVPEKVKYRGKLISLNEKQKLASGRAIWYIVKKGWGLSTAVQKSSGSFKCSPSVIERSVRSVFPEGYFINLQRAKNSNLMRDLTEDEE
tara:strand:- start:26 stop:340 length:315 start_codon:yes stop_codon:yes gene_type:complete